VLANLYTQVSEGALGIRGLLQPSGIVTEEADSYLEDEILQLLEDFPDTPQLIYAGSLSDDYDNSYAALKGLENVTREAALGKAQALAGEEESLAPMGASYGDLPCYYFGGDTENGAVTVSVTKQGGLPVMYLLEYTGEETAAMSEREAQPIAEEFLLRAGYGDLRFYDSEERDGLLELRYVFVDDKATYPDHSVKVAVGQGGVVVSMNAADYLRRHGSDAHTDKPGLTAEETAVKAVPAGLEVLRQELTWFTRDTGMSVLCYRFGCSDERGRKCVIYADANTGAQIEILTDEQNVSDM
jgi:germination protein YpeB